ncbi:DUF4352 domain-containing protein [Staphylococcus hominis]|uniref:DUF4352 domain-containing protein n=1 Tax=Staphylococcus hominis TaxID=1290 RepID=UPI0031B9DCA3
MEENNNQDQSQIQWEKFEEYQRQQEEIKKKKRKKRWLYGCGGCLGLFILIIIGITACSAIFVNTDSNSSSESTTNNDNTNSTTISKPKEKDTYKLGETVKKDGIEVTITSVEYALPNKEFSMAPKNGIALKVNFKFKNNNEDRILFQDGDFTISANGENYEQWYGSGDDNDGFSHFLNKDNTASGYVYYDVPDTNKYIIEMNFKPNIDTVKAKWVIKRSEVK